MTKEEFIDKVKELDSKQGNYELTLWRNRVTPERRLEHLKEYPEIGIKFFEWALSQGEQVYVYEDIYIRKKPHLSFYFVFPKYQMGIRFRSDNNFEESPIFKQVLRDFRKRGFIFFIENDDTLESVVDKFNRVKGYYFDHPRQGFLGSIVKPQRKKRARIKYEKIF